MVLKSGLIRVGQKQMDRFSLVMRFTLLLWLTLRATPGSRSELHPPVLTVTVPPAALLPPPPPCKLRTEEARAPWACPLRLPKWGALLWLCRKAACVSHSSAHGTPLCRERNRSGWKATLLRGSNGGQGCSSLHGFPWLPFALSHRTPVWVQHVVTAVREHGSWRASFFSGAGGRAGLSQTEAGQPEDEEPAPDELRTEPRSASSRSPLALTGGFPRRGRQTASPATYLFR